MIDFYVDINPGPNIRKVAIMFAECELEHRVVEVNIYNKASLPEEFVELSPSSTVPMIVNHARDQPLVVFESGAILLYLAELTGRFLPGDPERRAETMQWLFWQSSQLGAVFFHLNHLARRSVEQCEPAIRYFENRGALLMETLDRWLSQRAYLVGEYGLADIATYPWAADIVRAAKPSEFEYIRRWTEQIAMRPAVLAAQRQFSSRKV